ncbi:MAG: hypothetical protein WC565_08020 [Parcubacteria group bacterium]
MTRRRDTKGRFARPVQTCECQIWLRTEEDCEAERARMGYTAVFDYSTNRHYVQKVRP